MRCMENCNAWSQHRSTGWAQFVSMTKPDRISHNQTLQKLNKLGHGTLASSAIFTWPLNNWLLLQASWKFFSRKVLPQPTGCRKCLPRVCWIPKHRFLHYRNKKHLLPIDKNVLIVMVPILINKDVFEPSYNDLKFTVQNCNYVCTNLIVGDW